MNKSERNEGHVDAEDRGGFRALSLSLACSFLALALVRPHLSHRSSLYKVKECLSLYAGFCDAPVMATDAEGTNKLRPAFCGRSADQVG